MMTDEEIELARLRLVPLLGPTRAGWYAECCKVEHGSLPGVLTWACRYREMAREAGNLALVLVGLAQQAHQLSGEEIRQVVARTLLLNPQELACLYAPSGD